MDLSNMSIGDLRNLQDKIKQEMKNREQSEMAKAREQILAIAQSVGKPLQELMSAGTRKKTGTVPPRYRHPDNAAQQWTGRGRQPKWVKEWVDGGKSIDLLRI